ncbi:MAG: hypothetical protein N4J56_006594 [Chroococcidiopsis sp. SAG 2025]|nr:hypothetical protein [Chroococcidiopsis sp. SAG 2025]
MNILNQLKKLGKTAEVVSVVFEASTDIQCVNAQDFILKSVTVDNELPGGNSHGFTSVDLDSINLSDNDAFANIFLGNYSDRSSHQELGSSGYKSDIVRDFLTSVTLLALVLEIISSCVQDKKRERGCKEIQEKGFIESYHTITKPYEPG